MKQFSYIIKDELGIHARPAGLLAKEAKPFTSRITLRNGNLTAEATKVFMLMSLGVKKNDEITVTAEGEDEEAAITAMRSFLEKSL